jgi:hypothetical protein
MTELEKIKLELFNLVERVGTLPIQNENTIIFTKEQLQNYSKYLINELLDNVKTNIENDLDGDCLEEAVEIELGYNNRELTVHVDTRAIHCQIRSIVEESFNIRRDLEDAVTGALEYIFPVPEGTDPIIED